MRKKLKRIYVMLLLCTVLVTNCISNSLLVQAAVKAPTKISLNYKKKTVSVGETVTLKVKSVKPAKASKKVRWISSNKKIATVNNAGKVKAKRAGTVTITAKSKVNNKVVAKCKIKVYKATKKLKLTCKKNYTLKVGEKQRLGAKVISPKKGAAPITWASENKKIAKVNSKGIVTAVSQGKTTIVGKSGNKKVKVTIKVIKKATISTPEETVPEPSIPEESKQTKYNRAEWVGILIDKRGYDFSEESLNKDIETGQIIYSYDDIYDSANAFQIEAAVQNGVLPVENEGRNYLFFPEDNVTREFVAVTVARILGLTADKKIDSSDSEKLKYPAEIQAVLEKGIFTLKEGAFCPNELVTEEEFIKILQIVDEILGSWELDSNHVNVIEYTETVVENTSMMRNYTVSVVDGRLYVTLPNNENTRILKEG